MTAYERVLRRGWPFCALDLRPHDSFDEIWMRAQGRRCEKRPRVIIHQAIERSRGGGLVAEIAVFGRVFEQIKEL